MLQSFEIVLYFEISPLIVIDSLVLYVLKYVTKKHQSQRYNYFIILYLQYASILKHERLENIQRVFKKNIVTKMSLTTVARNAVSSFTW